MSRIRRNVKLAALTTFKIGGKAEFFCEVKTPEELLEAIEWAKNKNISWLVFAGASNIVFSDKTIKGLLIRCIGGKIHYLTDNKSFTNCRLMADAGVTLEKLIKKSVSLGFSGLETLSGIPGTVGGAIFGNAGAYGHSISEVVDKVEIWDGKIRRWLLKPQCRFEYRSSILKKKPYIILRVIFKFKKDDSKKLQKIARGIIAVRIKKYKPGLACSGSFFKNVLIKNVNRRSLNLIDKSKIIEGKIPAGYLLESVGVKGTESGRLKIADFHANLIINKGGAKAKEVKQIAKILKNKVYKKFGIKLEEEVIYI